jgi:putative ABC transport system permease protein
MNFLKRAWLYVIAKKGRSILLTFVFSAILIMVLLGITIRSASLHSTEQATKQIGAVAKVVIDNDKLMKKATEAQEKEGENFRGFGFDPLSASDATKIAKLKEVKTYYVSHFSTVYKNSGIVPFDDNENQSEQTVGEGTVQMDEGGGDAPDFTLMGVNELLQNADFKDGTAKIVKGRAINENDADKKSVVIEKTLAEKNGLKVGDSFTIQSMIDQNKIVKLKIVGLYQTDATVSDSGMTSVPGYVKPVNTMYTNYHLSNEIDMKKSPVVGEAVYYLRDPREIKTFEASTNKIIDTDKYKVTTNDSTYQKMLLPLKNIEKFANNIILLVVVAGVVILTLIVILSIRERKHEIGVLLSMGESKIKVIAQFFVEMFTIMILAIMIAGVSGNIVGNTVSQQLLNQQNEEQRQREEEEELSEISAIANGLQSKLADNEMKEEAKQIDELSVTVSTKELTALGLIAIGIVLLSVMLAAFSILRMQPSEILVSQ